MPVEQPVLEGQHVRLEPLEEHHIDGLMSAAADRSVYGWTVVPETRDEMARYVATALSWRDAGTAVPFATVRAADGVVIGSTRLYDFETWKWPEGHPRRGRMQPDVCEIGWTWLARPAIRTAANTEAKLLMLTHAFECWNVLRVCFHTDSRNERSRAAIERIGGRFEGLLRAHRMAVDYIPRDSARYSIVAPEWPETRQRLLRLLARG
jgi:RimJ/RimL family protein N-acetyltransferase